MTARAALEHNMRAMFGTFETQQKKQKNNEKKRNLFRPEPST
jgi:hypothetical protein